MAEEEEGAQALDRYEVVVNGMVTMLKLTPTQAQLMGLTKRAPARRASKPTTEAEDAATLAVEAEHKKRTVRS
jgi:hypothetical protein